MANPIYGKKKDKDSHHLVWDEGIISHDILSRIVPFLFEKIGIGENVSANDCMIVARCIRNWARLQKIWLHDIDEAFFRYGMTAFMPPFIEKLEQNADKFESVMPGMKREIREIYTKLNFSTFNAHPKHLVNNDEEEMDASAVFKCMLEMADFFEQSGGIIPEGKAHDDDHRADFAAFMKERDGTVPVDQMIATFIDEKIRPVIGDEPEYFDYIKKLVSPMIRKGR